ncbi:centrosomal protein of 70 kDa isoform X1 [Pseudophryne corroboree]|uniref:centrosomal protein of 70 kDa isoform X1 n=1 Tax=Pseudophryne corroboree TaxID=495146 RepID=UPI003081838A
MLMSQRGVDEETSKKEMDEWENINKILKRHGCRPVHVSEGDGFSGAIVLDSQASLALRSAVKLLVEDTERRQNLIHGLIQSNNQLKQDVRWQQDRAGRQEQRVNELQRILESVKVKLRDLEDDFIAKMRQHQAEMTNLLKEKEAAHEHCQKNREKLREQEEDIVRLKKRLAQAENTEEKRVDCQKKAFQRLLNREPREILLDQQILDVIDGYERQMRLLQNELRKYESVDYPVRERIYSEASLDLDATTNYKALIKSYQDQIKEARKRNEDLVRDNAQLREEMESRPTAREFKLYKQQMRKMEKILLQNNIRVRGVTRERTEEAPVQPASTDIRGVNGLPASECQQHLQDVCRELNVQDVKDLIPVAASRCRQAETCSRLHKILSDISKVVSGPRAPQLLYKHNTWMRENRGADTSDESDFIHLLPTVELWAGQLLSLQALHRALRTLSQKLLPDQQLNRTQEPSDSVRVEELLLLVDTMVEDVDSRKQDSTSVSPHTLQALVAHFQKLFDVPSVIGVYPRMNEVYSKLGEMNNAMKNLRSILGLDDLASAATLVSAVWGLCREAEGQSQKLQQILGTLDIDSIINKIEEHEEFFPAFDGLIKELLDVLEIDYLDAILPEVKRLKMLDSHGH